VEVGGGGGECMSFKLPGAVYQHQRKGAVQSERAQQASISGQAASVRAAHKGKEAAGEG
jgi:hypothetical protein